MGDYPDTCFVGPTVFENVTLDMTIAQEEVFGPVAMMMKASSLDEAIDMIHPLDEGGQVGVIHGLRVKTRRSMYSCIFASRS